MYELVIVWSNGDKNIYEYHSEEDAEEAGAGFRMAFGNQVAWYGTRRKM